MGIASHCRAEKLHGNLHHVNSVGQDTAEPVKLDFQPRFSLIERSKCGILIVLDYQAIA